MPSGAQNRGGAGPSLQTLVIAAAASAAAAVIVSHLWKGGTVIAAAMTPVIVAIVKELLARPMESEIVRKPVSKIASGSRAALGSAATRAPRTASGTRAGTGRGVGEIDPPPLSRERDPRPGTERDPSAGAQAQGRNGNGHPADALPTSGL